MAVGDCGERGKGCGVPVRHDNAPWAPGYLIDGVGRPFLVSYNEVKKQNYPDGAAEAIIIVDTIILSFNRAVEVKK